MASSSVSPWNKIERLNPVDVLIPAIKNALPQLSVVKSCAMIGCGTGRMDLALVRECFPNVTELAAVEPDADEMEKLKTNVSQLIPSANVDFYQETAQSWKGSSGKLFDAVLMFHCLYHVPPSERPFLYKKLIDHVLVSGGLVLVLISPSDRENVKGFNRVVGKIDIDGIEVGDELMSAGFKECRQLEIEYQVNLQEPNDDLMAIIVHWNEDPFMCLDDARRLVKEEFGDAKTVPREVWFGAFTKP